MNNIVIVDFRGLVLSYYSTCTEVEPLYDANAKPVTRFQTGVRAFLDHAWPMLNLMAESPNQIICVEDRGNQTRRNILQGYKNRPETEPVLKEQRSLCEQHVKNILMTFGVFFTYVNGEEADDVIAMLSKQLPGNISIITVDKDLFQLASDRVKVIRKGEVMEYFSPSGSSLELPPKLIPFALSLLGDASDTYAGVKGFGVKALEVMMESFSSEQIEDLHNAVLTQNKDLLLALRPDADGKAAKILDKLIDQWDSWCLHYKLARLYPDVGTNGLNPAKWDCRLGTEEEIVSAFTEAKLPYLAKTFVDQHAVTRTLITEDNLMHELSVFNNRVEQAPFVAWDYETTDREKRYESFKKGFVDARNSKITGVSFAVGYDCKSAYYFSVNHADTANLDVDIVPDLIQGIHSMGKPMVAHNVAYEGLVTWSQLGFKLPSWQDTQLMAFAADENSFVGLKTLSYRYLNYKQQTYDDVVNRSTSLQDSTEELDDSIEPDDDEDIEEVEDIGGDMESISGATALRYACDDSLVTAKLRYLFDYVGYIEGWRDHVVNSESLATAALTTITYSGIKVDKKEATKQEEGDVKLLIDCSEKIHNLLANNITDVDTSGLETYLEEMRKYCSVVDHRARSKGKVNTNRLATLRDKLSPFCFYVKPGYETIPYTFKYTVSKVNNVLEIIGLPSIDSLSKKAISEYLRSVEGLEKSEDAINFLDVWCEHVNGHVASEVGFERLHNEARKHLKVYDKTKPTGTHLDLSKSDHLVGLFYVLLGFPIRCRTKVKRGSLRHTYGLSGSPATDKSAIAFALVNDCDGAEWKLELLRTLSKYQKAQTRISNYWTPWKVWMSEDGFIHPYFKRFGTATHRPSSNNPNLNSIDKKGDVRRAIVPPFDDWVIFSNDFSAQELRRLANNSGSINLTAAFNGDSPVNPHSLVACDIAYHALPIQTEVTEKDLVLNGTTVDFKWLEEQLSIDSKVSSFLAKARGTAKVVNFGIPYGVTAPSLSEQTMLPLYVCEAAMAANAKAFPEIETWRQATLSFARDNGYVPTMFGLRRHCGNALSKGSRGEVARWARQLCNADIQGGCGAYSGAMLAGLEIEDLFGWIDHSKDGYTFNRDYSKGVSYRAVIYNNLYDEVLGACHRDDYLALNKHLIEIMERPSQGDVVKQVVDCSFGLNWKDQHEVGSYPSAEKVEKVMKNLFGDKDEQ